MPSLQCGLGIKNEWEANGKDGWSGLQIGMWERNDGMELGNGLQRHRIDLGSE